MLLLFFAQVCDETDRFLDDTHEQKANGASKKGYLSRIGSELGMKLNYGKISGALLFVGSAQFVIALTVAEALYPAYSISQNYISDLGATCRATCQVVQPTATYVLSTRRLL